MSPTRYPLPSFTLVLTSDCSFVPTRPSVIKFGFDPLQTVYPAPSAHEDVSDCPDDIQIQQIDPVPTVDEQTMLDALNDSETDVGQSEGDDESNAQTKKRTGFPRGFPTNNVKLEFMNLVAAIRKLLKAIPKTPKTRTSRV